MTNLFTRQGSEFLVNTAKMYSQYEPQVTGLTNGGFVVTWVTEDTTQDGSGWAIKAQVFTAAGGKQGGEFLVNTAKASYQEFPTITGLANGGFVVAWQTWDATQDGNGSAIKAQVFTAAGVRQGGEFLVNTAKTSDQKFSTVTGLFNGGFVVTWSTTDPTQDGNRAAVKAQVFSAAGVKQGAELLVNTATTGDQLYSTITTLANGGFVVTWGTWDAAQDGSGTAIKAQVFTAAGVKQGSEFLVNTATVGNQYGPTITGLANGGFVVTWQTDDPSQDGSDSAIKAQIFTAAGVKQGAEFLVNTATYGFQNYPTVTALANGGFVVNWTESDTPQSLNSQIRAQVFDAAGVKQGGDFPINTVAGFGDYYDTPTITALANGGFVVAWATGDPAQDGDGTAIKAQIFQPGDFSLSVAAVQETQVANVAFAQLSGNDAYSYALVSDSTGAFALQGDRLLVADNARLDYETAQTATLVVRATDANGFWFDKTLTLAITDASVETRYKAGAEFLVNTAVPADQMMPTITGLANGGFVVSWVTYDPAQDGSYSAIKAQVFSAAGAKQGAEFLVNTATTDSQLTPRITGLANGGFVVTWWTDDFAQDGSLYAIKAQVFTASGVKQGGEFLVNTGTVGVQFAPTITALSNGGFVVAWYDDFGDGNGPAITAQIFTASGVKQGAEFLVNTATTGSQLTPTITALSNGGFVVAWQTWDTAQDGNGSAIKAQVFTAAGAKQGAEFLVNTAASGDQSNPTITALSNGGFVVTWETWDSAQDGSGFAIKAQVFTAAGVKQGGEFLVNTANMFDQRMPTITGLANGGFVVTWYTDDVAQDGNGTATKAQVFDAAGVKQGAEFLVAAANAGNERFPTITALSDGGFSVAWTTDDANQDGSGAAIKARVFAPVNTAPVALDDTVVAGQGAVVTLPSAALLGNDSDADGDALSLVSVTAAVGGSAVLANGAVTFTPSAGFVGAAGFDYLVSDGKGGSDTGHVSVNVRPYLTVDDIVVSEGDGFATLTLRLSAPASQASTVTWSTSNGRAIGSSDYLSAAAQTVTFQPGQAVQTIQIPLLANTTIEGIEEFFVNFASSAVTLERSFAMVTIRDDDLADRAPVASVGDVTVDETDGTAHAVIVLDRASSAAVTVTYRTVAVSATAGSDFTARTGSVTFAAGQTTTTIDLAILNDSAAEADERFQFELTGISGVTGAAIGDGIAEITIAGNDRPIQAMPTVFVDDMVHSEGATEGYLTVSFRLSAPSASQTSVDWSAGGGTASINTDFTAFNPNTLVFAAGETVRTVRIPIRQDTAVERAEQFYITLSTPVGLQIDRAFATLTLVDDDDISRAPVASVGDLVLDEADGTAHFAITLDRASAVPVTVTYRTLNGTATGGSDFVARTGSVTFNPGETARTIDVAILNDALAEGLEMFRFELTGISGVTGAVIGDGMADAVIALNDGPTQATPTVIVDDMVYSEGATEGAMTVTFRLSAPSASQTSVDWLTGIGTAAGLDFRFFFASTLVFAAGETVKTVQIPILPDSLVEGTEQFSVNLANPVGLQIAKGFATMTLVDDDATGRAPIASVGDVAVNESDGLAHFAITLDRASAVPVTVTYRTVDGTATGGNDFVARTGSITFNPGETAKTIDVAILNDATGEAAESFTLKLTGISGVTDAAIGDGEATATIGLSDGTAAATPQLSVTAIPGIEGGANVASFLFQLSAPSASATSVSFSTPNGTATGGQDFATFGTTRLTFAPGETLKLVQIPLINDTTVEATETFGLNLTNPSGMTLAATSVTNSILDNDGSSVSVAVVTPELVEGTGTGAKTVKLIFAREGLTTAAQTVDWAVQTRSGATVDAADFTGGVLPSGQISFAAGQSVTTVTLSIAQDSVLEPDEAFDVVLSNPTAGLKLANATTGITILNDDAAPQATYAIAAASADKPEGNSGTTAFTFTVTRGVNTTGTGSVAWAVSGSGASPADAADFGGSLPGGTVSFLDGEVTKTVTVLVSGDTLIEADQGFAVTLSSPVSGTITTASAAGTIRNDDVPPQATYAIAAASADKPEGNSGTTAFTFTVTRGVSTTGTGSVAWAVSGSGASPADAADFGGSLPGGTVSFLDGEVTKTVTVLVSGDTLIEADQGFAVTLSSPVSGTITTASAAGTIRNDDVPPQATYAIAATSADKPEGNSGTTAFTFTVTRGVSTTGTGSVAWAVSGSGASPADAADFGGSLPGGTVSFAAGEVTKTVTVLVSGDTLAEADQGFAVTLSSPVSGTITTASAAGTIRNDDGTPGQTYNGTSANNTYVGGAGDDTIFGNGGNDTLSGGAGKDTIDGGIGKDKITGNAGADLLTGGAGADTFIFTALTDSTPALAGRDRITDFSHSDLDRINLSALDANTALTGNQAFVLVADDFTGTPGEISVASWGTKRLVQLDVDGDGVADFALTVTSATDLVAGDFIL